MQEEYLKEYPRIVLLRDVAELFEQLNQLEGVIILEEEKNRLGAVCELIMTIKKQSTCFIWIISSIEKEMDKLVYLQLGADFVLNKNSSKMEKELIIKNALLRNHFLLEKDASIKENTKSRRQNIGEFHLIPDNFSVMIDGDVEVSLTKLEFKLLDVLSQKPKMTFSYDEIEKQVYGSDSKTRQYRITNLIYHLRRKLERTTGQNKVYIKTVRSRGYMLDIYNNNVR